MEKFVNDLLNIREDEMQLSRRRHQHAERIGEDEAVHVRLSV